MEQIISNNISPMQLSGMILARLVRMNEGAKTEEEFYKLVHSVGAKEHLTPKARTLQ